MKKFACYLDKISLLSAYISAFALLAALGIIITEIILRSIFDTTMYVASEYSSYACCIISAMGLGYTFSNNGHVRMTFILSLMKGKWSLIWNLAVHGVGLFVVSQLAIVTFRFCVSSYVDKSVSMQISQTPLYIPQIFMVIGISVLCLQFISEIIKLIFMLCSNNSLKVADKVTDYI